MTVLAAPAFADPWRFEANPEVYLLVAFLVGAFVYMVRRIGPSAVSPIACIASACYRLPSLAGAS